MHIWRYHPTYYVNVTIVMLQKGDIIICIFQVVMFTMLHSSSLGMRIKCGAHLPRQRRTAKLGSNPKKTTKAAQLSENPFGYSIKNPRLCWLHSALHFYHGILSKTLQNLQDLPKKRPSIAVKSTGQSSCPLSPLLFWASPLLRRTQIIWAIKNTTVDWSL